MVVGCLGIYLGTTVGEPEREEERERERENTDPSLFTGVLDQVSPKAKYTSGRFGSINQHVLSLCKSVGWRFLFLAAKSICSAVWCLVSYFPCLNLSFFLCHTRGWDGQGPFKL